MSVLFILLIYIKLAIILFVDCGIVVFTVVRIIGKKFWFAAMSIFADI